MKEWDSRQLAGDLLVDLVGGMLISVGLYNFALHANFPVAGFSGIAIILYHLSGIPVGLGILILNVPVAAICYRLLGRGFFLKSVKSMLIVTILTDYVAPIFPVYEGERLLAALCMGVLSGSGYALIYMRASSTGGQDFITMSIRKWRPHVTVGAVTLCLDTAVILFGSIVVFRELDGFLYGLIVSWLAAAVMNRLMYGIYEGKMTLIVSEQGRKVAEEIEKTAGRGTTIISGVGGYSGRRKDVVLCACNNKEMYWIKRQVREIDPCAFTIIVESNEVVGEGFRTGSV